MIEVRDLRKRFVHVTAVNGLSFSAADGAITGILGENGAGKTTTMAMMCGLLQPDAGVVCVDGTCGDPLDARRRIGALIDHQGVYARLTAWENIAYFGELHGLSRTALTRSIAHLVDVLGLDELADRRTGGFSQGERVKVALARALVHSPQNLLLDEVTNGLDVSAVRSLRVLLSRLRAEGRCIVFSSHVLDELRTLCDHIVVISKGRLIAQGSADAICDNAETTTLEDAFVKLTSRQEQPSCLPI